MDRLLSRVTNFLSRLFSRPANGPDEPAVVDLRLRISTVAIWVNEKSKIQGTPPRAKAKNFLPRPFEGRLELSTYCLEELQIGEQWDLLDSHSPKAVLGKAELHATDIKDERLALDPNWDPERHVNVVDWPEPDEAQKQIAQALLAKQRFTPR